VEKSPPTLTSHLIRPLLDLVEQGKDIPRAQAISKGLRNNKIHRQIYGIAQILDRGKQSKRLETLAELLKILELPKDLARVTYRQPTKQKAPPTTPKKKEVVIKKWWKIPVKGKAKA